MFPFPQSVNPAVRTHLDAQTAFVNDMTKSLFNSFQQMCDLNIKLVQTMLEETTLASQQLLTADRAPAALNAAASRAQPAAEKLRAYQQHISKLAADAQVQLARVTEEHVQTTSRTAKALADEVARNASEETERGIRNQQETLRQFSDPFEQAAGQARPRGDGAASKAQAGASMQSGSPGASQSASSQGSSSGSSVDVQGQAGGVGGSMHADISSGQGRQGTPPRNP